MTKQERIDQLNNRLEVLQAWALRCEHELNWLVDCQFPYTCLEECYCYQNGMRDEKGEPK